MADFIVDITERLDEFVHQSSRQRVVRVLARYGDLFFGQPAVLSRSHLPSLVGTSREMTSRVIRQLEREGMVARVGRNGLQLLAPERLHDAAGRRWKRLPDPEGISASRAGGHGWGGRIRTFDLLIQSQAPYRLATPQ